MKIKYYYDGFGEINEEYERKLNIIGLNQEKDIKHTGYIYVLNIDGTDVCKIGTSVNVFERIQAIRQIIKSVFPYIENAITYNVYISKPVHQRFKLEKDLHNIFSLNNLDGEWFKCDFNEVITVLKKVQQAYIYERGLEYVHYMFEEKYYNLYLLEKEFSRIKYLKCVSSLLFEKYLRQEKSKLFSPNGFYLSDNCTPYELCQALEDYLSFIDKANLKELTSLDRTKINSYKVNARKQIMSLISKIKEGVFNDN
ncbi:MAG: GIY-YIG nuclease family protein [Hungatella sp.]|nr:GIY-YIG nuclease family protein [Hungatella sp.]